MVAAANVQTPEPGVYPDVPMADYQKWDAASNSRLRPTLRSGAHLLAYLEADDVDTAAFAYGRASHMALFEPDLFAGAFVPEPDVNSPELKDYANPRAAKAYKEALALLEASGKTVLKAGELDDVFRARDAVLKHPKAAKIINATGRAELSVVWVDEATGTLCKGRFDWHTPTYAGGAIVDLKTTDDASPGAFERAIFRWGYHRQGAFYLRAARALKIPAVHFTIIAVEKKAPYGVILYRLKDEAIRLGDAQLDFALHRYAECKRTGEYPGYTTDVIDIGVPKWADAAVERDLEEQVI